MPFSHAVKLTAKSDAVGQAETLPIIRSKITQNNPSRQAERLQQPCSGAYEVPYKLCKCTSSGLTLLSCCVSEHSSLLMLQCVNFPTHITYTVVHMRFL